MRESQAVKERQLAHMNNKKLNNNKSILQGAILSLSVLLLGPAYALEFECTSGEYNRFIRQELPGITNLCEVTVTNAQKERRVMWYANHDTRFCSEKAIELKNKYVNEWGFSCEQWPDHDGVDNLNKRQRDILDAELKQLIERGQRQAVPFVVEGLKAAASPGTSDTENADINTLVVQFFLHQPETGELFDETHVIRDDGLLWNTLSTIDTLATQIEPSAGYTIDSALISSVTDAGAMEIITVLNAENNSGSDAGCYGNQTLLAQKNGELIPRTPHRFICAEASR